jgi:hypothetical protein
MKNTRVHMLMAIFSVACILFLATSSTSAQMSGWFREDLTLHEKTTSTGGPQGAGQQSSGTAYLSKNAIRHSDSAGTDSIIRFDEKRLINIDHKKKTYTSMTFEEMQKMMDDLGQKMGKEGGEDQQQAMDAMKKLFGNVADSVKVTKMGPGEKVAGYATEKYQVQMGFLQMEMWAAPDLKMPPVYYDSFKLKMKNPMFDMSKLYDEFKKIDGYPLKQVMVMNMMGMKMTTTKETTSVEKGAIPASTFDIPAGYKASEAKF